MLVSNFWRSRSSALRLWISVPTAEAAKVRIPAKAVVVSGVNSLLTQPVSEPLRSSSRARSSYSCCAFSSSRARRRSSRLYAFPSSGMGILSYFCRPATRNCIDAVAVADAEEER